jgi:glycosyltransferase involved in cell wall biosynthesis
MTRRRILFVIKNLQQGGTERQVLRMMRCLDRDRFETALCTLSPEVHYSDLPCGEPRYRFQVRGARAVAAVRDAIEDFGPDLVHSFRDGVNRVVWRALKRAPPALPWLMSVRGRPVLPMDLLWARVMRRRAFRITTNSVGVERTLRRFAGISEQKIVVVPNFIDEDAFSPATPRLRGAARLDLGLPPSAFVWVLPARLSWVKNQFGLLEALRRLKQRGALPAEARVVLAGRARDRIPVALLPRMVKLFGLEPWVRIIDAVEDASLLYAAADALVLPSWAEGMPNVVLEAQLSGLPIVVTHQANRDQLVSDGEDGFTVRTGSPGALARAMSRMMSLPDGERQNMGSRGRLRVMHRFSTPAIADRLSAIYRDATGPFPMDTPRARAPLPAALAEPDALAEAQAEAEEQQQVYPRRFSA